MTTTTDHDCSRCGVVLMGDRQRKQGYHDRCPRDIGSIRPERHPRLEVLHDHLREHGEATADDLRKMGLKEWRTDEVEDTGVLKPCRAMRCRNLTTNSDGICDGCVGPSKTEDNT